MPQQANVLTQIEAKRDGLTAKQQLLADYILKNYKTAAFQNSTKWARLAKVSGSTVVRFAEELGYAGFPQLQEALHRVVQREINTAEVFRSSDTSSSIPTEGGFFHPCLDSFKQIEKTLSQESIEQAAKQLAEARNIYVAGFQGSSFLAEHMTYFLSKIHPNVFRVNALDSSLVHFMADGQGEQDVALIYAFPRFPIMTCHIADFFHERKVPIVCVSTVYLNRVSELAQISIGVDIEYRAYIDHLTPVLYISEVLAKRVAKIAPDLSVQQLEQFERFVKDAHIFSE